MTQVMGREQRIKREPRRGERNSPLIVMWIEFLSPLRGLLLLANLDSHGLRRGLHSVAPKGASDFRFSGDAGQPSEVAPAMSALCVEGMFDGQSLVNDAADGFDDGERVIVARIEYVAPDQCAAHVRARLEPGRKLSQERRRIADGFSA